MVGGEGVYVAWDVWQKTPDDDPDWLPYAVGMSPQPFCKQPAEITRDMSASAVWKGLIGQEIDFAYLDPDHQILEIRGGSSAVYCSSYSTGLKFWGMDVLHVSASRPTRTSPGGSKQ
jgi:hypothetical protein